MLSIFVEGNVAQVNFPECLYVGTLLKRPNQHHVPRKETQLEQEEIQVLGASSDL